jgi:hypothetical protein
MLGERLCLCLRSPDVIERQAAYTQHAVLPSLARRHYMQALVVQVGARLPGTQAGQAVIANTPTLQARRAATTLCCEPVCAEHVCCVSRGIEVGVKVVESSGSSSTRIYLQSK